MKSLTVKQAEKWLDRLRSDSPDSFKEILKHLKKYEKNNDQQQCFIRLNTVLLNHSALTVELNVYLEESNKLVVNQTQVQRINQLVKYVKIIKPVAFDEIVAFIKVLSSKKDPNMNQEQQNKILKEFVLQKVQGNLDLENYADIALNYSAQEMIRRLDLSHLLKSTRAPLNLPRNGESLQQNNNSAYQISRQQDIIYEEPKPKIRLHPPFININEQKMFLKSLQQSLNPDNYQSLMKIMEIYQLGIITKMEALQLLKPIMGAQFQGIKDILETRQTDRRRNCPFRPLNDMEFSQSQRATRSYVRMPSSYPNICTHKEQGIQQILNREWVSVPVGSEDQFNLRIRNNFEQNLIKAEDERHETDLTIKKMQVCIQTLDTIIQNITQNKNFNLEEAIRKLANLGIVQYIYRNAAKQQKDELQFHMKQNPAGTSTKFRDRIEIQLTELKQIRNIQGLKIWNQVASKNTVKALDIKGHEFKRTQKNRMKPNVFIEQMKNKINYLEKRGAIKSYDAPFQEKKQFFSVLNSFETSSRKEKCLYRKYAIPQTYNLQQIEVPSLLPAMILAFQDKNAFKLTLSYIFFYIENSISNQSEKLRCNYILRVILNLFFGIKKIQQRKINQQQFDEEKFLSKIGKAVQNPQDEKKSVAEYNWIKIQEEQEDYHIQIEEIINPNLKSFEEQNFQFGHLPPKDKDNIVFFASESFYVVLRFMYAIYERIIRLYEVTEGDQNKTSLFELLYFNHIKTKQNSRFQECLNLLLNDNAFMFTTFYKLMQGLIKSVSTLANCSITNYSLKMLPTRTQQQIYLFFINRFFLHNPALSSKIMRFTYYRNTTQLLYINSLHSFYKADENNKDLLKRRADINSKMDTYVNSAMKQYKQLQGVPHQALVNNKIEYHLEGNTIKLLNLAKGEDVIVDSKYNQSKKSRIKKKILSKQIEKLKKVHDYLD